MSAWGLNRSGTEIQYCRVAGHSLYMIGATGSVRGKKEFEPNSLAPESEPLLGPHLEDYWSIEDYWARSGGLLG